MNNECLPIEAKKAIFKNVLVLSFFDGSDTIALYVRRDVKVKLNAVGLGNLFGIMKRQNQE